jgi:ABC-type nitrate/sulfonate/bicarbonate transport system ATPase subunit
MLELKNLSKFYQHKEYVVAIMENLNLTIKDNEFIAFVGPSGCGKTTLLKLIAGLIAPSAGEITLDGKKILGPSKERGVVFQHFSLFPWLTVEENTSFGLDLQRINKQEKKAIVSHYLEITHLKKYAKFYPKDLSGGMQQRVSIARAIANDPKVLLMDEPFSSLDPQIRGQLLDFITNIYENEHKTILFITHDVTEAILLADTVYVMSAKPMTIRSIFAIPFVRPRYHSLKYTNEFFDLERKIALELESSA